MQEVCASHRRHLLQSLLVHTRQGQNQCTQSEKIGAKASEDTKSAPPEGRCAGDARHGEKIAMAEGRGSRGGQVERHQEERQQAQAEEER